MKNLKLMAAGALMLAAVSVSTAQEASNAKSMAPSFGIKGGVNFATVTGDFDSPDSRTSFHAGALAEFPLADIFSIQVEALYSGQGFKANFEGPEGDKAEVQLDYINVPVLAKVYIVPGLSLEAGPQFSFKVRDKFEINPGSSDGTVNLDHSSLSAKDFEFGVAGGLTFQTEIGLFATGRYNYGLTEVFENKNVGKVNNSVFQIGVGYKF